MQDYQKLLVWQRAHALVLSVYELTREYPPDERFGLTSQTRRCAVSIASNIAEGSGRSTDRDFAHFLHIAVGSTNELEYQLLLARDLGFIVAPHGEVISAETVEVRRMLIALIGTVRRANTLQTAS